MPVLLGSTAAVVIIALLKVPLGTVFNTTVTSVGANKSKIV
jgi:hypothetical protein